MLPGARAPRWNTVRFGYVDNTYTSGMHMLGIYEVHIPLGMHMLGIYMVYIPRVCVSNSTRTNQVYI